MKYVKPLSLVALGMLLMLLFSNATIRVAHLNQHAVTTNGAATEDIHTHRTTLEIEPTVEFHPAEIFGSEKPKE